MPAPFAAIEARVNRAVFRRLSNASGTLAGAPVSGIFSAAYAEASMDAMGVAGSAPQIQLPTASVPADWEGAALVITTGIGVGSYMVREHQPDGAGVSVLILGAA